MSSQELEWLFPKLVEQDRIDVAFDLLLRNADRLRGYLCERFQRFTGGRAVVEVVVVEAILKALRAPEEFDRTRHVRLEVWLFGIGLELVQERIRQDLQEGRPELEDGASQAARARRAALEEEIDRLPDPERKVARLDLEHGGRAPIRVLAQALGANEEQVFAWRNGAREALMDRLNPEEEHDG